jgi:O-methyltransferase
MNKHRVRMILASPAIALAAVRYPREMGLVRRISTSDLTYLEPEALMDLVNLVHRAESRRVQGVLIEAGCALGGSAIVMTAAKREERPLYVYDTFGRIPPPSGRDAADVHERYRIISSGRSEGINGDKYYGYRENLYQEVCDSFSSFGFPLQENSVHLVKGLFDHTLTGTEAVAIAHIDCDWYDSVFTCLSRIVPRLIVGGTIVLDDYYSWSGCRKATDDYFADKRDRFSFTRRARLHVSKVRQSTTQD